MKTFKNIVVILCSLLMISILTFLSIRLYYDARYDTKSTCSLDYEMVIYRIDRWTDNITLIASPERGKGYRIRFPIKDVDFNVDN